MATASKPDKSKDALAKPAAIPDKYILSVTNHTDDEIDLWFFNCRHFMPAVGAVSDDDNNVVVIENGGPVGYTKWIGMERILGGQTREWDADHIRQFFQPSGWFVVLARYRKLNDAKQNEEFLGCFDLLKNDRPQLDIDRALGADQEFSTHIASSK